MLKQTHSLLGEGLGEGIIKHNLTTLFVSSLTVKIENISLISILTDQACEFAALIVSLVGLTFALA